MHAHTDSTLIAHVEEMRNIKNEPRWRRERRRRKQQNEREEEEEKHRGGRERLTTSETE